MNLYLFRVTLKPSSKIVLFLLESFKENMPTHKKKADDDLVTISQAARLRGVSPQAIDDLISRARLEPVEVAGLRLLRREDVINFKPSKGGKPRKK